MIGFKVKVGRSGSSDVGGTGDDDEELRVDRRVNDGRGSIHIVATLAFRRSTDPLALSIHRQLN